MGDLLRLAFSPGSRSKRSESCRRSPGSTPGWFDSLFELRFDGDLWAIPRGDDRLRGASHWSVSRRPWRQAQWIETFLIASIRLPDAR